MLSVKVVGCRKLYAVSLLCGSLIMTGCQGYSITEDSHFTNIQLSRTTGSPSVSVYIVLGIPKNLEYSDGVAHYTEHLVWNGISSAGKIKADQHSNAWTSNTTVGYWFSGSKSDFPIMLKQLSTVFAPISVTPVFAKQEANIVLRERDYRFADNVYAEANIQMNKFLYKGNPSATSVIGDAAAIRNLNLDEAKTFHSATHKQDNAVLLVIGDLSKRDVYAAIKEAEIAPLTRKTLPLVPARFSFAGVAIDKFYVNKVDVQPRMVWRKIIKLDSSVEYDTLDLNSRVVSHILGSNLPGGLAGPLRYQAFITSSFDVNVSAIDEQHAELRFSAAPDSGVSIQQLQTAFEVALKESIKGISAATLDRVWKRKGAFEPDWNENKQVEGWRGNYVFRRVSMWREPLATADVQQLGADLTLESVNKLLKAFGSPGRLAVTFFTDNKEEAR